VDPDPDPSDPNVFGPPGSVSQRYGFGYRTKQKLSEKLYPIYLLPEMKLRVLPHSCICERFMYFHDWSTYFAAVWLERDRTMVFKRMVGTRK
jgi:hypothetical protein